MKNKRNKKLLASFLFALGLSTNQVNVSAKNGQIRDTLADLIWCNSAKNEERDNLGKIASKIDELVTTFNNKAYKEEADLIDKYIEIYNDLKEEFKRIWYRRDSRGDAKIYSKLALSIKNNEFLREFILGAREAQNNVFEFFKNAQSLDFGTWSVWKRVKPSLDRLLSNEGLKKILSENNEELKNFLGVQHGKLENTWENNNVTASIYADGHLVVDILNSSQTVLGPLLSNDLKSQVRSVSFQGDVSKIKILDGTFKGFNNLESIEIPSSVEVIGNNAFGNCTNLKYVNFLGNSLKTISSMSFSNCESLESIEIPSSVEVMGIGAFNGCTNLKNAKIPHKFKDGKSHIAGCFDFYEKIHFDYH